MSVYYNFYYYSIELDIDRIFQFSKKKIIVAIPSGTSDEIGTLQKKKKNYSSNETHIWKQSVGP